jgi:hypothetical protein
MFLSDLLQRQMKFDTCIEGIQVHITQSIRAGDLLSQLFDLWNVLGNGMN